MFTHTHTHILLLIYGSDTLNSNYNVKPSYVIGTVLIIHTTSLQIYILLYKEVSIALKINSLYSQKRLLNIHENVKVMRYPDHFAAGIYLWYAFY